MEDTIAIITTSKYQFERYVKENRLNPKFVRQVRVLSDVKNRIFDYAVEIEGSENVTDYVIARVNVRTKD
jgi:hypothetical protein